MILASVIPLAAQPSLATTKSPAVSDTVKATHTIIANEGTAIAIVFVLLVIIVAIVFTWLIPYLNRREKTTIAREEAKETREIQREQRREEREKEQQGELKEIITQMAEINTSTLEVIRQNSEIIKDTRETHRIMDANIDSIRRDIEDIVTRLVTAEKIDGEILSLIKKLAFKFMEYDQVLPSDTNTTNPNCDQPRRNNADY